MPSTCTRKSYGGKRNVAAYANRLMRAKYPSFNAHRTFQNMGSATNAMINKNKQQANAAANAALNASKAAVTVEAAVNTAKKNNGNFWNSLKFGNTKMNIAGNNAAKAAVASTNAALNKAQNMAKLANNAAKVAANAAKVANSLRSAAATGGSRRNRSRRNRSRRNRN